MENVEQQEEDLIVWNYLHEVCAVGVPWDQMDQKSDVRWRSNQEKKIEDQSRKWKKEKNENDDDDEVKKKWKKMYAYIKVKNIHFNPSGKLAFKSNSFSCNLVQNYNLVRKLIPN